MDAINNILISITYLFMLIVISIASYWLKQAANFFKDLKITNQKSKNSREIQREAYFREISGKDIVNTLDYWISILIGSKTIDNQIEYNQKIKETLMYGSEKTVKILSITMQHFFEQNEQTKNYNKEKKDEYNAVSMILLCSLICSLKYDFTGYDMHPLDLLKSKINDFYDNKDIFMKAYKQSQSLIDDILRK